MTNPDTQFGAKRGLDPKEAQKKSAEVRKHNNEVRGILDDITDEDALILLLENAFNKATSGDTNMTKFLIDQMAGKATQRTEITGSVDTKNLELLEELKKDFDDEY